MKKMLLGLALTVVGAINTHGQTTTYAQEVPVLCTVATLQCHNIELLPGNGDSYSIGEPYDELYSGAQFSIKLAGTLHPGHITVVHTQFPEVGTSAAFSFSFATQDGLTGTVSGQGEWVREGTNRWWYAVIESSTVTVD